MDMSVPDQREGSGPGQESPQQKKDAETGPVGGVLSPTLFIIFINNILKDIPRWIHGVINADDLVI